MNGILIVNKPKEYTSQDICAIVKKIAKVKVGHTGTLDPMATGVLPLLLGEGTKLSEYITNHNKTYEAVIQLGLQTETADSEGKIIKEQEINISNMQTKKVQEVLHSFEGKQVQTPPIYSAIKIKGKKLYEYAREGKQVEIPKREIEIYNIQLLEIQEQNKTIKFKVQCSKGTYIRSLCEDIAKKLQTVGYMKELKRLQVGNFSIENSVTLKKIEENEHNEQFWNKNIISIKNFFENFCKITITQKQLKLFLNGVQLTTNSKDGLYKIEDENGNFIGIGIVKNKLLKRKLVI